MRRAQFRLALKVMRSIVLFSLCTCLGLSVFGADFRSVSWGASSEEVLASETEKPKYQTPEEIVFATQIGDLSVTISYEFKKAKLDSARYEFVGQHRESERYVMDYHFVEQLLTQKYGAAASTEVRCQDDFYRDYPFRWGAGIVANKLSLLSKWETPTTHITHGIRVTPRGPVSHYVDYARTDELPKENPFKGFYDAL